MKRNDWILLVSVLSLAIIALIFCYLFFGGKGTVAVVTVDGKEIARLDLKKDTELLVNGYNGGTNLVVVKNGKALIQEASCPDRICVHTGEADELKSIVCAPHRVVVRIEEN